MVKVQKVFIPGEDYPELTYVERNEGEYESNLQFKLEQPSSVIVLSGPSKSGKTMLLENALRSLDYQKIEIHGSEISSKKDLWERALDNLDEPKKETLGSETKITTKIKAKVGTWLGLSGFAKSEKLEKETESYGRRGLDQVIESIDTDQKVLFLDDAHYIDQDTHQEIAESIKSASKKGMKVVLAYIHHRSDDLTKANPDLGGRVGSISLDYWDINNLVKIGKKGFNQLNLDLEDSVVKNLARESVKSPHLMQSLCLELCREKGIEEDAEEQKKVEVNLSDLKKSLRNQANESERQKKVYTKASGNVDTGGAVRNTYEFIDGNEGDVYDAIVRAIAMNPPKLSLSLSELHRRVSEICVDDVPRQSNFTQRVQQLDKWVDRLEDDSHRVSWDAETKDLQIADPYFVFYLRWSDQIDFEPELKFEL